MQIKKNLVLEFKKNSGTLEFLWNENNHLYEEVKSHLSVVKALGKALIGNPALKLENKVIELFYLIMQHNMNCNIYIDLIEGPTVDEDLRLQLMSLLTISRNIKKRHLKLYHQWHAIKGHHARTLSVSA